MNKVIGYERSLNMNKVESFDINKFIPTIKKVIYISHEPRPFSQLSKWHFSVFEGQNGEKYNCIAHYLAAMKAHLFSDFEMKQTIIETGDIESIKKLEKQIKNFDEKFWKEFEYNITVAGIYMQFSQSFYLQQTLLLTGDSILSDQYCFSSIWGCNSVFLSNESDVSLYGKALMEVRKKLFNK